MTAGVIGQGRFGSHDPYIYIYICTQYYRFAFLQIGDALQCMLQCPAFDDAPDGRLGQIKQCPLPAEKSTERSKEEGER